jgi:hypothetical protein
VPYATARVRIGLATSAVILLIVAGACGSDDSPSTSSSGSEPAIVDVATLGKSQTEKWSLLADRWADSALDEANTAGELLNDPRDRRRLLAGRAPVVRERVLGALDALGPRCAALESEVPPAPAELEKAAASLKQACSRFDRARADLIDAMDADDREIFDQGLTRLARGVNAIADAKQRIAPLLG